MIDTELSNYVVVDSVKLAVRAVDVLAVVDVSVMEVGLQIEGGWSQTGPGHTRLP